MHSTLVRAAAALAGEVHRSSEVGEEEAVGVVAVVVHLLVSFGPFQPMHLRLWYRLQLAACGAIGWRQALCPVRWVAWLGARENK